MKCQRIGCDKSALWRPVLLVTPDGAHYAEGHLNLVVCGDHKMQIKAEDLITDEGWKMIVAGLLVSGKAEPKRELTKVKWVAAAFDGIKLWPKD